jgi:hypothetical protein
VKALGKTKARELAEAKILFPPHDAGVLRGKRSTDYNLLLSVERKKTQIWLGGPLHSRPPCSAACSFLGVQRLTLALTAAGSGKPYADGEDTAAPAASGNATDGVAAGVAETAAVSQEDTLPTHEFGL